MDYLKYLTSLAILIFVSVLYENFKKRDGDDKDTEHYELVKQYLLNDSSLAQSKRPIIWIHMNYDVNARWWPSFYSRNTRCLNQPYQYITIKSIIDKCGADFNICLIDDNSFQRILPGWGIELNKVGEPVRGKLRRLAIAKMLHTYGGLLLPGSFLCFQNLISLYEGGVANGQIVVGELIDRNSSAVTRGVFPNSKIMGCQPECPVMAEYIRYLEGIDSDDFTDESNFLGEENRWFLERANKGHVSVVPASLWGVKDTSDDLVTLDRLMGNTYVDFPPSALGLYIPDDEIINRTAYQWFARLNAGQALTSNTTIGKLLLTNSQ